MYRISKAYSLYDEEVSYCQGLSFLAAALLLHVCNFSPLLKTFSIVDFDMSSLYTKIIFQMPEEQAFCTLVKIMFDYGLRDLFKLGFDVLHLRFYQLQRLIEVILSIYS